MRIAGTLPCSFVNGDGARYVIFLQGCRHHCQGCQNPSTWDFSGGRDVDIGELAKSVLEAFKHPLDGITLSGGDPFYQQDECVKLLRLLPGVNIWIYTGFLYEEIKDTVLANLADVIIDGPYIERLKCYGKPYGSSNQRIIRREYGKKKDKPKKEAAESRRPGKG